MKLIAVLILSYLIGAIPFALLLGKGLKKVDIREHGSGNLGTTNTMRVLGAKVGSLVLIGDMGKGVLCAWMGYMLGQDSLAMLAGLVAVFGHVFSIYVHFKGGKGIATGGGVFLFVMPGVFFLGIAIFLLVLLSTRYVSLSSLLAALTIAILATVSGYRGFILWVTWAVLFFVIYTHRENIGRLMRREENKANLFGKKG